MSNQIDTAKLVLDLRNMATYLRFATDMPAKVPQLLYMAADEIEAHGSGPEPASITSAMIDDMRRAVRTLVRKRKHG